MRIISGIYKGRKIFNPVDKSTRPLKDIVRESIFNILEHSNLFKKKIQEANILDLFSGTGSFGLECISRGAAKVIFVENYPKVIKILKKNIEKLSCKEKTKIIEADVYKQFIHKNLKEKIDFIFIDPPFKEKNLDKLAINLKKNKIIKKNTILIIHIHKNSKHCIFKEIQILNQKIYGKSKIIFAVWK